jgi:hypothetical protein
MPDELLKVFLEEIWVVRLPDSVRQWKVNEVN